MSAQKQDAPSTPRLELRKLHAQRGRLLSEITRDERAFLYDPTNERNRLRLRELRGEVTDLEQQIGRVYALVTGLEALAAKS